MVGFAMLGVSAAIVSFGAWLYVMIVEETTYGGGF
jgi:hypothetical protein